MGNINHFAKILGCSLKYSAVFIYNFEQICLLGSVKDDASLS